MANYQLEKALVLEYFDAMQAAMHATVHTTAHTTAQAAVVGDLAKVQARFIAEEYQFFGVYPFNQLSDSFAVLDKVWSPLSQSFKHLQRRQDVFMAGANQISGEPWVMSMGHFFGLFDRDWLGIRANRKMVMLRYAEFNCVEEGKITKTGLWLDIIGLMHQVGINPLPPQTGASFVYPGPSRHHGLLFEAQPDAEGEKTLSVLHTMIEDLSELNQNGNDCPGPEFMEKHWHQDMLWYGPAGIGASYTIPRYLEQHMYPFRQGLHNKVFNGHVCRFAEGELACFFGWPNLSNQAKGGFLGLPSSDIRADMRVVDVYTRSGDRLLENWVFVDIPYWLKQQGVDILERTAKIVNPTLSKGVNYHD